MLLLQGHTQGGQIILDEGPALPDGIVVTVSVPVSAEATSTPRPVRPIMTTAIFPSQNPGSLELTSDRIAEILQAEDIESLNVSAGH